MTVGRIDLGSNDMLASVRMCFLHEIVESMVCSKSCFAKRRIHLVNTKGDKLGRVLIGAAIG